MFARFFARRRLRKAVIAFRAAYDANRSATDRQDTRAMHETRAALRSAQNERLAAEIALSKLEGFGGLRRAA